MTNQFRFEINGWFLNLYNSNKYLNLGKGKFNVLEMNFLHFLNFFTNYIKVSWNLKFFTDQWYICDKFISLNYFN